MKTTWQDTVRKKTMNLRKNIGICFPSISHDKYLIVSVRMLFREYSCKNAGVAGYAEAFTTVLSGKQTSETYGYLSRLILVFYIKAAPESVRTL